MRVGTVYEIYFDLPAGPHGHATGTFQGFRDGKVSFGHLSDQGMNLTIAAHRLVRVIEIHRVSRLVTTRELIYERGGDSHE